MLLVDRKGLGLMVEEAPAAVSAAALLYGFGGTVIATLASVVVWQSREMRKKDDTILRMAIGANTARLKTAEWMAELTQMLKERLP